MNGQIPQIVRFIVKCPENNTRNLFTTINNTIEIPEVGKRIETWIQFKSLGGYLRILNTIQCVRISFVVIILPQQVPTLMIQFDASHSQLMILHFSGTILWIVKF